MVYEEIVIGIDQSYRNTGITIVADGAIRDVRSVYLDKCKSNSEKREVLRNHLDKLLRLATSKANNVVCIVERARIHGGSTSFINIDAIKAMGALTATIVDRCAIYGVAVFSVDTRCWKSQVVGTSRGCPNKYGVPEEKWPTVRWLVSKGFKHKILEDWTGQKRSKGSWTDQAGKKWHYNDDAADSAGIAMFWIVGDHDKLKEEQ